MTKTGIEQVINYYHTPESRMGYKMILGGVKHFGYYPDKRKSISMRRAMRNMVDQLIERLAVSSDSHVLDAGCGEGFSALQVADTLGCRVTGLDLLDFNIEAANKRAQSSNLDSKVSFVVGDYHNLPFEDSSLDAIYTMETFVHAVDYKQVLSEFHRILKPGGKVILFEYSMPKNEDMDTQTTEAFKTVNEGWAMHALPHFRHGGFPDIMKKAGFEQTKVENISEYMKPMMRRFWQLAIIPYQLIRFFGAQKRFTNATAGVLLYKHFDSFRYNIITAHKPKS